MQTSEIELWLTVCKQRGENLTTRYCQCRGAYGRARAGAAEKERGNINNASRLFNTQYQSVCYDDLPGQAERKKNYRANIGK